LRPLQKVNLGRCDLLRHCGGALPFFSTVSYKSALGGPCDFNIPNIFVTTVRHLIGCSLLRQKIDWWM